MQSVALLNRLTCCSPACYGPQLLEKLLPLAWHSEVSTASEDNCRSRPHLLPCTPVSSLRWALLRTGLIACQCPASESSGPAPAHHTNRERASDCELGIMAQISSSAHQCHVCIRSSAPVITVQGCCAQIGLTPVLLWEPGAQTYSGKLASTGKDV